MASDILRSINRWIMLTDALRPSRSFRGPLDYCICWFPISVSSLAYWSNKCYSIRRIVKHPQHFARSSCNELPGLIMLCMTLLLKSLKIHLGLGVPKKNWIYIYSMSYPCITLWRVRKEEHTPGRYFHNNRTCPHRDAESAMLIYFYFLFES